MDICVRKTEEILIRLNSPFSVRDLDENIFDFIRWICNHYDESIDAIKSELIQDLLECLPQLCNLKELVLALLEEINNFKSNDKFVALIVPIQKCLQNIPNNFVNVTRAYETLCAHLESEPIPPEVVECVDELPLNAKYSQILQMCEMFLKSFGYFVDELHCNLIQSRPKSESQPIKNAEDYSHILLRVFARPLAYLPLHKNEGSCEMQCLSLFEKLQTDIMKFLFKTVEWKQECKRVLMKNREKTIQEIEDGDKKDEYDDDDSDETVDSVCWDVEAGCGVLCYMVFRDDYKGDLIPQVFTNSYVFYSLLPVINNLICMTDRTYHHIDKGCTLMLNVLRKVGTQGLEAGISDSDSIKQLTTNLIETLPTCMVKEISFKSLQCINALLWAMQPSDRLDFLSFIIHTSNHSSLQGFVITAIKNQLVEVGVGSLNVSALKKLLPHIFSFKTLYPKDPSESSSSQTNIFEFMDKILATLNFLIYLIISSSKMKDKRGIYDFKPIISNAQKDLLDPLRQNIEDSRLQCITHEANLIKRNESKDEGVLRSVTVSNSSCDELTKEQNENTIKLMMVKLDLLEDLLNRAQTLMTESVQDMQSVTAPTDSLAPLTVYEPILKRRYTNSRVSPLDLYSSLS